MAARLLAVVVAAAMVAGALAARGRLDEGERRRSTVLRLTCSVELADVCAALGRHGDVRVEPTVEPAGATADRLAAVGPGRPAPMDGWLAAGPWARISGDARRRAGLEALVAPGPVLARSPVVLAVRSDRVAAMEAACPGRTVGWRCLGDLAGRPWAELGGQPQWGAVRPGYPDPATGAGLAVLGAATAAWFGRTDLGRADLDEAEYRAWITRLVRSAPSHPPSPLTTMVVRRSAFDAVGTTEAEAGPLLAAGDRPDEPALFYPSPVATADVVLGSAPGRRGRMLADLVAGPAGRRALAAGGWRVAGRAGPPGGPALPPGDTLPPPGLLAALRRVVAEAAR